MRYADDCNIYVKSARAGERVLGSVRRFLEQKLKLKVNEQKSKVDRSGANGRFWVFAYSSGKGRCWWVWRRSRWNDVATTYAD